MANKRFIKIALLTTGVTSIAAAVIAFVTVRAPIATVQPFVAIMVEEVTPRADQPPTPITRLQTIAVRSDGSICRVYKWDVRLPSRVLYSREVIDATSRTHVVVEDYTRTVVNDKYFDIQALKPRIRCKGKLAGKMQGFDVVYSEQVMVTADSDTRMTHKLWAAPQLGCYPIVEEWEGKIHGQPTDTRQTLASIKLGEPDRWYFNVPANYTARTSEEWMGLISPLLKQ
jgi:hypothetical protein